MASATLVHPCTSRENVRTAHATANISTVAEQVNEGALSYVFSKTYVQRRYCFYRGDILRKSVRVEYVTQCRATICRTLVSW